MNGMLKVLLVDGRELKEVDSMGKMDPYVLIQYKDQKLKSKVAKDHGRNPVWNDDLTLLVKYPEENEDYNLTLKVMDKDTFSADDIIGEARINLKDLVLRGVEKGTAELEPRFYKVLNSKNAHAGEVQLAFNLTVRAQ